MSEFQNDDTTTTTTTATSLLDIGSRLPSDNDIIGSPISSDIDLLNIGSRISSDNLLDIGSRISSDNLLDIGSRISHDNIQHDNDSDYAHQLIPETTTENSSSSSSNSSSSSSKNSSSSSNNNSSSSSSSNSSSLLEIGSRITHDNIAHQLISENISDQNNLIETSVLLGIGSRVSESTLNNNDNIYDDINDDINDTTTILEKGEKEDVVLSQRSEEFMSLSQITTELNEILKVANMGGKYNENRLNVLIQAQKENPEYQAQLEEERRRWRSTVDEFLIKSLITMRTFVPPNIHSAGLESLAEAGLSSDIAKRLLNKKCLWLVRMSPEEISRLHEADLFGRYNTSGQVLDIVEIAAIYCSLPDQYLNDHSGKKKEWADLLEQNLKQMLIEQEKNTLPKGKQRSPIYKEEIGPITDLDTLKDFEFVTSKTERKSFQEVCSRHSIFRYKDNQQEDRQEEN